MLHKRLIPAALLMAGVGLSAGCYRYTGLVDAPAPLGTTVDPFFQQMESNAEASDFVIYEHEFVGASAELNAGGQDHLKEIAARLAQVPYPVIIAQSQITSRERDYYKYPIHYNEQLDLERRELIVQALTQMAVPDAQQRVV